VTIEQVRTISSSGERHCAQESGDRKDFLTDDAEGVGNADTINLCPLVERIDDNAAAAALEGGSEEWFLRDRLGARVEQPVADLLILRPGRDQAPPHPLEHALPGLVDEDADRLRRFDVRRR
jgi:hypothetical protein